MKLKLIKIMFFLSIIVILIGCGQADFTIDKNHDANIYGNHITEERHEEIDDSIIKGENIDQLSIKNRNVKKDRYYKKVDLNQVNDNSGKKSLLSDNTSTDGELTGYVKQIEGDSKGEFLGVLKKGEHLADENEDGYNYEYYYLDFGVTQTLYIYYYDDESIGMENTNKINLVSSEHYELDDYLNKLVQVEGEAIHSGNSNGVKIIANSIIEADREVDISNEKLVTHKNGYYYLYKPFISCTEAEKEEVGEALMPLLKAQLGALYDLANLNYDDLRKNDPSMDDVLIIWILYEYNMICNDKNIVPMIWDSFEFVEDANSKYGQSYYNTLSYKQTYEIVKRVFGSEMLLREFYDGESFICIDEGTDTIQFYSDGIGIPSENKGNVELIGITDYYLQYLVNYDGIWFYIEASIGQDNDKRGYWSFHEVSSKINPKQQKYLEDNYGTIAYIDKY